jgi:hypothetical protein
MELNKEDIQIFKSWLTSQSVSSVCESCNAQTKWHIGPNFIHSVSVDPVTPIAADKTMPMVYLVCGGCGHLRLYSSVVVGIPQTKTGGLSMDRLSVW